MPRMNGIDAARELSEICPDVPIVLYTMHADVIRRAGELPTGVTAVVAKTENLVARIFESLALVYPSPPAHRDFLNFSSVF